MAKMEREQLQAHIASLLSGDSQAVASIEASLQAAEAVSADPEKQWLHLTQQLSPAYPFALHQLLHRWIFRSWNAQQRPAPVWIPSPAVIERANITQVCAELGFEHYEALHRWSVTDRRAFWQWFLEKIGVRLRQPAEAVVTIPGQLETPVWLPDAQMNIVESCFQAHPDTLALIGEREDGQSVQWSYEELWYWTHRIAAALQQRGMQPGERIAIYMPMNHWAVAWYLGIILAGGVVVSIADSLAPAEVQRRMAIAGARTVVTQDIQVRGGKPLPLYDKVVEAAAETAIVLPYDTLSVQLRPRDVRWDEFLTAEADPEPAITDPMMMINILFSSGTTGDPKAIPWNHTTPLRCAADAFFHHDIHPDDRLAWPTNLGWMMGPWLIFASLLNKAAMALYDGNPATAAFCQFVERTQVTMLGVVPSLVKRWREKNATANTDWRQLRLFSSTGEASNAEDYFWLMVQAHYKPVIEYCGGTEIGGGYITGTVVHPAVPSTFTTPSIAMDFVILDDSGNPSDRGEIFIVPPTIGLSVQLLNRDHHQEYFAGTPPVSGAMVGALGTPVLDQFAQWDAPPVLRRHGDEMERLPGWYYRAHGRADDTMNLGGIKVSSVEIERVLNALEGVWETAAVGITPPQGGPQQLVIFAVVESHSDDPAYWQQQFQNAIRQQLNPLFHIADVRLLSQLPRTASNKIMRRVLRQQYQKQN